jgi:MYXO-CTERM domain-containing protein
MVDLGSSPLMSPDRRSGSKVPDDAHDVLAAEEFGVPAPDPDLHHHGPVSLPEDPTGIAEPHDVLAAEEFALPAPRYGGGEPFGVTRPTPRPSRRTTFALAGLAFAFLRRRRRKRRS